MKKILVFENDPHLFEYTGLFTWLSANGYSQWDFARTIEWDLGDLIKCGVDLVEKYDTIATETGFEMPKRDSKDESFEGGQIKEMIMLLDAVLPLRKSPLTVIYSQMIVGGTKLTAKGFRDYLTSDETFIRFSSYTNRVLKNKNLNLKILNLNK